MLKDKTVVEIRHCVCRCTKWHTFSLRFHLLAFCLECAQYSFPIQTKKKWHISICITEIWSKHKAIFSSLENNGTSILIKSLVKKILEWVTDLIIINIKSSSWKSSMSCIQPKTMIKSVNGIGLWVTKTLSNDDCGEGLSAGLFALFAHSIFLWLLCWTIYPTTTPPSTEKTPVSYAIKNHHERQASNTSW